MQSFLIVLDFCWSCYKILNAISANLVWSIKIEMFAALKIVKQESNTVAASANQIDMEVYHAVESVSAYLRALWGYALTLLFQSKMSSCEEQVLSIRKQLEKMTSEDSDQSQALDLLNCLGNLKINLSILTSTR